MWYRQVLKGDKDSTSFGMVTEIRAWLRRFKKKLGIKLSRTSRQASTDQGAPPIVPSSGAGAGTANVPSEPHVPDTTQVLEDDPPGGTAAPASHIQEVTDEIQRAEHDLRSADRLGGTMGQVINSTPEVWKASRSTWDLLTDVGSGLKILSRVVDAAGKPFIAQDERDEAFEEMLTKMRDTFRHVEKELYPEHSTSSKKPVRYETELLLEILQASERCAHFIKAEYITRNFWARGTKNVGHGSEIDHRIEGFGIEFAELQNAWQRAKIEYLVRDVGPSRGENYLQNTRAGVFEQLSKWIEDPEARQVLFLVGVAGSGKSVIADTIASKRESIGAFFAFDRGVEGRGPRHLLRTIAYQLAWWNERYWDELVKGLKAMPFLADSLDIGVQWEHLIVKPLEELSSLPSVLLRQKTNLANVC
ncbi:hypothetical protein AURDEDRAFT_129920 [Auricularia subglabra TFB-10046 SS5]|uniref:Nephrocystin 3-like N-terminal domain-containing protein n=1 Tax=Auricularia subglabra (strain TFB-10046 / SS5) TaxID=717982 RepID=J0D9T0_AURST|nr:hypothetical protein AURDEDRAFT_129920 [Auricularia subglabra TFB-10046 SS5]